MAGLMTGLLERSLAVVWAVVVVDSLRDVIILGFTLCGDHSGGGFGASLLSLE